MSYNVILSGELNGLFLSSINNDEYGNNKSEVTPLFSGRASRNNILSSDTSQNYTTDNNRYAIAA
jgi:hypothetical protein